MSFNQDITVSALGPSVVVPVTTRPPNASTSFEGGISVAPMPAPNSETATVYTSVAVGSGLNTGLYGWSIVSGTGSANIRVRLAVYAPIISGLLAVGFGFGPGSNVYSDFYSANPFAAYPSVAFTSAGYYGSPNPVSAPLTFVNQPSLVIEYTLPVLTSALTTFYIVYAASATSGYAFQASASLLIV
jgi:hypothetical protein